MFSPISDQGFPALSKLSDHPPVWVAEDVSEALDFYFKQFSPHKISILADTNTSEFCLPILKSKIKSLENAHLITIEAGEASKSVDSCAMIWKELNKNGTDRKSLLCNLGGGIVGDLGGFAASTFMRGIPFIQVPTSLLAMVDASIGGKTGINFSGIKNLVGTFQQPAGIFIQPGFLSSLPEEELVSGFAEMAKHALIEGGDHWRKIMNIEPKDSKELRNLIVESVALKLSITEKDFKESGLREVLNLGHTSAHALEALYFSAGKQIMHGYAVAAGLAIETYIAQHLKTGLSETEAEHIRQFIYLKIPSVSFDSSQIEALIDLMDHDKKNREGKIRFSLLASIGKPIQGCDAPREVIRNAFNNYLADVSHP
jgi:3-dehydroquinate synthase